MKSAFVFFAFFLLFLLNGVYRVRDHERFAVFRLGRFFRVAGPGWIFLIPVVDKKMRINLDRRIPGWNRMTREALNEKIRSIASVMKGKSF